MPTLSDPFFQKSVILLCDYTRDTAFGMVINRPSTIRMGDIILDQNTKLDHLNCPILVGGPVQPEFFWAIHSSDFADVSTTKVDLTISMSSVQEVLAGVSRGDGPETFHLGFGYAGWGPGQLDREIREGAWWVAPLNTDLVLKMPYNQRWEAVLQSIGIDPCTTSFFTTGEA